MVVRQISSSAVEDKNINEVCGVETGIYDELEDLRAQGGINNNLNYSDSINSEYEVQPVLTELGSEQFVELNDFYSLWEGDPSDLVVPSDMCVQCPLVENPSSPNLNNMHVQTFSVSSVAAAENDPLPVGTGMINDQSAVFLEVHVFYFLLCCLGVCHFHVLSHCIFSFSFSLLLFLISLLDGRFWKICAGDECSCL